MSKSFSPCFFHVHVFVLFLFWLSRSLYETSINIFSSRNWFELGWGGGGGGGGG